MTRVSGFFYTDRHCRTKKIFRQILRTASDLCRLAKRKNCCTKRFMQQFGIDFGQRSVIFSSLSLVLSTKMERFVVRCSIWRIVNGFCEDAMSIVVLPAFVPRT